MLGVVMFSFFVVLLPCVYPQGNPSRVYFCDNYGNFKLIGSDVSGKGPVVWRWKPHSEKYTEIDLVTLTRSSWGWEEISHNSYNSDFFHNMNKYYHYMRKESQTTSLIFYSPKYKFAGLFLLTQPENNKTLNQCEAFGVKVEKEKNYFHPGSDITLICSISSLPDGVSLQWKHRESTQHNSRNNTEQLLIHHTLYLIVRHVREDDKQLHMCEVQDNGSIVLSAKVDFHFYEHPPQKSTFYRSNTNHSELQLICKTNHQYDEFRWNWKPHYLNYPQTQIASFHKDKNIIVNRKHFGERLRPAATVFNGKDFTMHIVPVMFEDAGIYTCFVRTFSYVTVELITVKVTADTGTDGANTNLTCSVSKVTETVRLVWMGNGSKTFFTEKILKPESQEEKSLSLSVQGADGGTWTCVLFLQNSPRVAIPYYLEPSANKVSPNINIYFYVLILMILLILLVTVVLCVIKFKVSGPANKRQDFQQPQERLSDGTLLHSNIQASKSGQDSSNFEEYATLNQQEPKPSENDEAQNTTELNSEEIHYASVNFQNKPGSNSMKQCNNEELSANTGTLDEEPGVIYASVAKGT